MRSRHQATRGTAEGRQHRGNAAGVGALFPGPPDAPLGCFDHAQQGNVAHWETDPAGYTYDECAALAAAARQPWFALEFPTGYRGARASCGWGGGLAYASGGAVPLYRCADVVDAEGRLLGGRGVLVAPQLGPRGCGVYLKVPFSQPSAAEAAEAAR